MQIVDSVWVKIWSELDTKSFEASAKQIKRYARDTKKEIDPILFNKLQLNVAEFQQKLDQARKELKLAKASGDKDLQLTARINVNELTSNLTEAKRQFNNLKNTGDPALSRLQVKFNQVWWEASKFAEILGAIGITAGIQTVANSVITLAGNLQQARIAFGTMVWSASEAEVLLKDLAEFAKTTPFELTGLREQSKLLLAYWFNANEIIPVLESLGNISAWVWVDKLPRLTYALGQVRAAWKLTGQDFRQFTETWVSLGDELSKITGIAEINSWNVASLGITYEQVAQALSNLWWEGGRFGWLMEAQSQTLQGAVSNLQDSFNILWEQVGQVFLPVLTKIVWLITPIVTKITERSAENPRLSATIFGITWWLVALWWALVWLSVVLPTITAWLASMGIAWTAAWAAAATAWWVATVSLMSILWPIWLVIAAWALLVTAYNKNFWGLKDAIDWVVEKLKYFAEATKVVLWFIGNIFKSIWNSVRKRLWDMSNDTNSTVNKINKAWSKLTKGQWFIKAIFDWIGNIIRSRLNSYVKMVDKAINLINKAFGTNIRSASSVLWSINTAVIGNRLEQTRQENPLAPIAWGITDISKIDFSSIKAVSSSIDDVAESVTWLSESVWWWGWGWSLKEDIEDVVEEVDNLDSTFQSTTKWVSELGEKWKEALTNISKSIEDSTSKLENFKKQIEDIDWQLAWVDESIGKRIIAIEDQLTKEIDPQQRTALEQELALAKQNITAETLQKVRDEEAKSETQKLLDKKLALEAQKLQIEQAYNDELEMYKKLTEGKVALEQYLTEQQGIELQKRQSAFDKYVDRTINSIAGSPVVWEWSTSTVNNNQRNTTINAQISSSIDLETLSRKLS